MFTPYKRPRLVKASKPKVSGGWKVNQTAASIWSKYTASQSGKK